MDSILLTGSTGLAASKVLQRSRGGDYLVELLGRSIPYAGMLSSAPFYEADVLDADEVLAVAKRVRPKMIIHTAAMTDVDGCERDPDAAWQVNVEGSRNVAAAAAVVGAHIVFVSTDYVYSGDNGPYHETDTPDPRSVYGKTKLAAERAIIELCPTASIARTSTLYGYATSVRANFATWLIGKLQAGEQVTVVTDQVSSPTLAENLAEMLLALAAKRASGVFHAVGAEWMTRYDFACTIADTFALDRYLIRPGRTVDLNQLAPRPAHSGLYVDKIRQIDVEPLKVKDALRYLRRQMDKAAV